jgi:hypothetical protein
MKKFGLIVFASLLLSIVVSAKANTLNELAVQTLSNDKAITANAINELRSKRQEGLDSLLNNFAVEIEQFQIDDKKSEKWLKIANAIDNVAMQKDVYASKLFWYTDLAEAKAEAAKQHKPILTLRLLGNLNEEFSCANSRFFRAILYSNSEISKYLRENYILHWKSVRPAPKVTIDFGDGRKIERTITGNSIHYILSENGDVIDALPGLYSPHEFLRYLTQSKQLNSLFGKDKKANQLAVFQYRKVKLDEIQAKRDNAVKLSGVKLVESAKGVSAIEVAPLAMTKMITEVPLLIGLSDNFTKFSPNISLDDWKKLSANYSVNTNLDGNSVAFIRRQNPELSKTDFSRLITNTENFVALDTTQNEFVFHAQLYVWLNAETVRDLEGFNANVYSRIFKTPSSDKWLGLYQTDIYTALDGGGIIK